MFAATVVSEFDEAATCSLIGPAGAPYSFFDASKPDLGLWPMFGPPDTLPVSKQNPPKIDPQPMQVVRTPRPWR